MNTRDIRRKFLDYFASNGHEVVPSSPLVPNNDKTLLFTNAGMVQFKDVFLGNDKRKYNKAVTSQRCVRAGGKHNDLDNVGYTARHHTFFEMLGNFSFGDYFKEKAIEHAWTLLTREYQLPPNKLWVTVFDGDDEAEKIWLKHIGIPKERLTRIATSDNFWTMGESGPCGPCSEIFYDHGPSVLGGPPGTPGADGDRFVEIWNLVFMQFNRDIDGVDSPLPKPSVDTGMGLERLAAVLQGVQSNYQIDLFINLINAAAEIVGCSDKNNNSLKVIADHIRSSAILIADGVIPSNEGRGYVLRRIIRRAIRHGYQLGATDPFMHELVTPLVEEMSEACPELLNNQDHVKSTLLLEGERFTETLSHGIRILEEQLESNTGKFIPGDLIFRLYDTYGFPADLTADYARERGLSMDIAGFEEAMSNQRKMARSASQFHMDVIPVVKIKERTVFTGYKNNENNATVIAIIRDNDEVSCLSENDPGLVILDASPFYAESGGQVGDHGCLSWSSGEFKVEDAFFLAHKVIAHSGKLIKGSIELGQEVRAKVNKNSRLLTAANHSATHLLHAALKDILGSHVEQKGSLVESARLRFDFSHDKPMTRDQIENVEKLVNSQVRLNSEIDTQIMNLDDARDKGAQALFGERYEDKVRVVGMGDFSLELCGGTHVKRTGDIGNLRITTESGVAAGVRRVEAITREASETYSMSDSRTLQRLTVALKTSRGEIEEKVLSMFDRVRELERKVEDLRTEVVAGGVSDDLASEIIDVDGVSVLIKRFDNVDIKGMRIIMDRVRNEVDSAIIVFGGVNQQKANLLVNVSKDLTSRFHAGNLVRQLAEKLDGKGGGRPDSAQGGGVNIEGLDKALSAVTEYIRYY